jgi:hypothetical protein
MDVISGVLGSRHSCARWARSTPCCDLIRFVQVLWERLIGETSTEVVEIHSADDRLVLSAEQGGGGGVYSNAVL